MSSGLLSLAIIMETSAHLPFVMDTKATTTCNLLGLVVCLCHRDQKLNISPEWIVLIVLSLSLSRTTCGSAGA